MIPLKKNFTYLILNDEGQINSRHDAAIACSESGGYVLDTRVISQYEWNFAGFELLHTKYIGSRCIKQYFSKFEKHKQSLMIVRTLSVKDGGFTDELELINDDLEDHTFLAELKLDSDFIDMFEVRGHVPSEGVRDVYRHQSSNRYDAHYIAPDDVKSEVQLELEGFKFNEQMAIAARSKRLLKINAKFTSTYSIASTIQGISEDWLSSKSIPDHTKVYRQAERDLHDLLLSTEHGLTIAAGIPWFVTPFGRDSIISSWFLLNTYPDLARGTLQFLAANQGTKIDEYRDEQPGKILHEQRYAELSRLGKLPFLTYFGTADATPLFIVLLHDYVEKTKDYSLVDELKDNWKSALHWMEKYQDERGLIVFRGNTKGLTVQSWKDSHDSLSYKNGKLGEGALAVAEVQGYAYAAYLAAANFYKHENDVKQAAYYKEKADKLQHSFDSLFWMPEHNNFAIAVDEHNCQLDVNSSDSGHLLWSGIVLDEKVDVLVNRLFEEDMWSGWGLRTLSTTELRYNPISYHNGSIWPHDTAIFAAGLKRYGKEKEFGVVKSALVDVASSQKDRRLPELFSGYPRGLTPILPYVEACRPQAWSAAALVYLMNDGE